ncbi:UbiA prenyltransferase family protein [Salinarimonas chemoclinalis]|uniref:UbiA prenyltransferase family protein n=1 Tax=Salinarimonas chemoclinalis TaxID=3241599 RepID=UPI003557325B
MIRDLQHARHPVDHLVRRVGDHLALLRPTHAAKSLVAISIGPALMLGEATLPALVTLAGAIALFVLASSAVYVVNDLADVERDRLHPKKRLRPLASGAVTPTAALWMLAGLAAGMVVLAIVLPPLLGVIVFLYLACNLAYSLALKHTPIVEMLIVAAGFALRTASGYVAFSAMPDPWVIATVLAGSLLLTIGKRRAELQRAHDSAEHRPVLAHYSQPLLDAYLLVAGIACFAASLAVLVDTLSSVNRPALVFVSLPFVIYLFQRYLLLAFAGRGTGNPTRLLLGDRVTHVVLVAWAATLVLAALLGDVVLDGWVAALEAGGTLS